MTQYAMARLSFRHFLPFVKVERTGHGMVPLELWPHVLETVDALEVHSLLVIAKARQIGFTTILSAYGLWHAMYIPRGLVLNTSKGEREAWDFLGKARDTYQALPPELKVPLGQGTDFPNNREQLSFENGGRLLALPSTEGAGRGLNPTLVLMDEADRHEFLDLAYNSVKPGLADNGGQLVMFTTVNAEKMGGLYQDTYQNAPNNGFQKIFFGWWVRPGRDQAWYVAERLTYDDKALFEKEFPGTEEEAFAPAKTVGFFDRDILISMKADTKEPVEIMSTGNDVQANIYQKFQAGKRYTAATDTSHGTGHDDAVTVILDVTTGAAVADIHSSVIDPTELGIASVELLNSYDSPMWAIEDNDWGIMVIRIAQELKYKRLYYRDNDIPGWHTFDTAAHATPGSRFVMWGDLSRAIRSRLITIFNAEGLAQFLTVIRNPKKQSRIEAQQGSKDDYPMAVGIAWQIRDQAHRAGGSRGKREEMEFSVRRSSQYVWG